MWESRGLIERHLVCCLSNLEFDTLCLMLSVFEFFSQSETFWRSFSFTLSKPSLLESFCFTTHTDQVKLFSALTIIHNTNSYFICLSHVHTCTETKSGTLLRSVRCHRSVPGGLLLSGPSRPPVSESLRQADQAAWRQGPEARMHTASHSGAALRLDHWAAGTGAWRWLFPWGKASSKMTQRQTGRDDTMSRISNSLTGTASNGERLTQRQTEESKIRDLW